MQTIHLFEAIRQMRTISKEGGTFSLIHATYNRDTGKTEGTRQVRSAHLRPAARKEDVANADHKLFYYDMDAALPRVCWQPLLMFFNGIRITSHE